MRVKSESDLPSAVAVTLRAVASLYDHCAPPPNSIDAA
jgi:hypothetical protein